MLTGSIAEEVLSQESEDHREYELHFDNSQDFWIACLCKVMLKWLLTKDRSRGP